MQSICSHTMITSHLKKKKKKATVCPSDKESIWMCHKCFQELLYNNKLFLNLEVVFG